MEQLSTLQLAAIWALPVLLAVTVHEFAHGWVAYKRGDDTAHYMGRLTLNPFRHIDPVGTLLVPALLMSLKAEFLFGWAKPVPISWERLKSPRKDIALVALAGPFANFLMVILWASIVKIVLTIFETKTHSGNSALQYLVYTGMAGININLILMIFNLIPIPPLDGSKVLMCLLPPAIVAKYARYESFGMIVLFLLLLSGYLSVFLEPVLTFFANLVIQTFSLG